MHGARFGCGGPYTRAAPFALAGRSDYIRLMAIPDQEAPFRSYAGRLLLAMPDMPDPNFHHAVVAMCVHDTEGAMGIDLGTALEGVSLHVLLENFGLDTGGVADMPVLRGGPVEPRRGFILHSLDWRNEHMVAVGNAWGLCGSLDILRDIAEGRGPSRYVVALGYAGWGAGQLDEELTRPGWFIGDAHDEVLFGTRAERRWETAFARSGIDPHHIASQSGHA